jgi:ABC-type sulfate transport system substrate-binding protein
MIRFFSKPRSGGAADTPDVDARPRGGARLMAAGIASAALMLGVAACGGSSDDSGGSSGGGSIDLVGYSTPEEAYTNDLEPGFTATSDGDGVEFSNSFGASGDQSRAVEAGQPADVVHFALEPDMTRLVDAGMVADDWQNNEYKGIVENSVVVFVVRKGNPDNIQSWDDLVTGDEEVLTPNPFTSGGARWNLMAAYGNKVLTEGASEEEGIQYLSDLLSNVPVQDESARDALGTFLGGKGDVLLSYENDAIAAQAAGEDTDEAQQLWADNGYRPVVKSVFDKNADKFPTPADLFTIDDLGGWDQVSTDFFDPASGSVAEIEKNLGVATE